MAESVKNGRPTVPARARSTHHRGSAPAGSPISIGSGSKTLATISTAMWNGRCHRSATRVLISVGVEVSQQQHGLEEDNASAPHRGAAPKDWKQNLSHEGLHHEEQRRGEENRDREEPFQQRSVNVVACGLWQGLDCMRLITSRARRSEASQRAPATLESLRVASSFVEGRATARKPSRRDTKTTMIAKKNNVSFPRDLRNFAVFVTPP